MISKMTLNTTRSQHKVPHTSIPDSKFQPVSFYSLFRVTAHFVKSALNDSKITLNTTKSTYMYQYASLVLTSLHRFAVRVAISQKFTISYFHIDHNVKFQHLKKNKKKLKVHKRPRVLTFCWTFCQMKP